MSPSQLVFILSLLHYSSPQVVDRVTYQDLTVGGTAVASSTCGLQGPEDFMPVGDRDGKVCYSGEPSLSHPASSLTDTDNVQDTGTRTWWQSANGVQEVSLTLNFSGFFFVDSISIDFKSPRPSALVIEGSQDFGSSFQPLRYFSFDCDGDFGLADSASKRSIVRRDQLICTSNFTDGVKGAENMVIYDPSSCSGCPDGDNFLATHTLTGLRVRLVRYSGLISRLGNPYLSSYYAIYDISVPGACVCNGQLENAEIQNGSLLCPCSIPQVLPFSCATPTSGGLCRSCSPGFYRSLELDECMPCNCDLRWSAHEVCDVTTGQCECHSGTTGQQCQSCFPGYIGPSPFLTTPCIRCFCNGFSAGPCSTEDGWYQARAESVFADELDMTGFTTQGKISFSPDGYLEVSADGDSNQLVVSFPPSYLGDKRTSFSQSLTLNLSLPGLSDPSHSVDVYMEIVPFITTTSPADRLRAKLDVQAQTQQQEVKVVFSQVHTTFSLLSYFSGRGPAKTAKDRDIRIALSNIVSLRLILTFPKELPSSSKVVRLHYASLGYATRNSTHLAATPLESVNYVEQCTCPSSRTGAHCQTCASSFTINPPYGGEFAHCVDCFCNFRSNECDPVSGVCFNCTARSTGSSCEDCVVGYDKLLPYSFAPCDVCASGYYDLGNATCVACDCNTEGSSALNCSSFTGQCLCKPGVVGLKCDNCSSESTGVFPSCEVCDECSDGWTERLLELESFVRVAVDIVSGLNITQASVPELDGLFNLTNIIQEALHSNSVLSLSSRITILHQLICNLINRTEALIERAQSFSTRRQESRSAAERLLHNAANLSAILSDLESEANEIASVLDTVDLTMVNSSIASSLSLANSARVRVLTAIDLIKINFTSSLLQLNNTLQEFNRLYLSLRLRDNEVKNRLDLVGAKLEVSELLLRDIDRRVCGKEGVENVSCDACGGSGCGTCGNEEFCSGLAREAAESVNVSATAFNEANDFLSNLQLAVLHLEDLEGVALNVLNRSVDVLDDLKGASEEADAILTKIRNLLREIELELNITRVTPDSIGVLVNATLSLKLVKDPEEFLSVLMTINSTIDMFFSMFMRNATDTELQRRVDVALAKARSALAIIRQVALNFTRLSTEYNRVTVEFNASLALNQTLHESLSSSNSTMNSVEAVLESSQSSIQSSRSSLTGLQNRVNTLEVRVQGNLEELQRARELTAMATRVSEQVDASASVLESQASELASDSRQKLEQSEEELRMAEDIRNRTCALQELAQEQLLTLERLIRTEAFLRAEQLTIRSDIERVANEIQLLEARLRLHINRNTICMDPTVVSRKRRRRKRQTSI